MVVTNTIPRQQQQQQPRYSHHQSSSLLNVAPADTMSVPDDEPPTQDHTGPTATNAANNDTSLDEDDEHTLEEEDEDDLYNCLPTEIGLTLLCLDHLRTLRRSYTPQHLAQVEGLSADYITIAVWALSRSILRPSHLTQPATTMRTLSNSGNDAFVPAHAQAPAGGNATKLPTLSHMEREVLGDFGIDEKKQDDTEIFYDYDDLHVSNLHRYYGLGGLASGPHLPGPLSLGQVVAGGLQALGARSRLEAERDMIQSPLFEQFVQAVAQKGFFAAAAAAAPPPGSGNNTDSNGHYHERYRKVVAKFRTKLATKADADGDGNGACGDLLALAAAEGYRKQFSYKVAQVAQDNNVEQFVEYGDDDDALVDGGPEGGGNNNTSLADDVQSQGGTSVSIPASYVGRHNLAQKLLRGAVQGNVLNNDAPPSTHSEPKINPADIDEAERKKTQGNNHMQRKEYQLAADCYTAALKLCPTGPHSHVYFSNRAAALVSMKQFAEAVLDSERSLALKPDYGKAHARLGLAHFLMGHYRQAMEAYTVALKYDPDNANSQNYLEKAAQRLAKEEGNAADINHYVATNKREHHGSNSSYSVVSEWDKTKSATAKADEAQKQADQREAERCKVKGNALMASRKYDAALDAYNEAIRLCPNGQHSHVYYSNRAAALCYLERYREAQADSLQSLELEPTYGKAHARLGLSRFFLQDYEGAVEAYTAALDHDPTNAASRSYLQKAQAKLAEQMNLPHAAARKMMQDPDMRRLAQRALHSNAANLWDDPDAKLVAKKAVADPSVWSALTHNAGKK